MPAAFALALGFGPESRNAISAGFVSTPTRAIPAGTRSDVYSPLTICTASVKVPPEVVTRNVTRPAGSGSPLRVTLPRTVTRGGTVSAEHPAAAQVRAAREQSQKTRRVMGTPELRGVGRRGQPIRAVPDRLGEGSRRGRFWEPGVSRA